MPFDATKNLGSAIYITNNNVFADFKSQTKKQIINAQTPIYFLFVSLITM